MNRRPYLDPQLTLLAYSIRLAIVHGEFRRKAPTKEKT